MYNSYYGNECVDLNRLCRVCGGASKDLIPVFDKDGRRTELLENIEAYLPMVKLMEDHGGLVSHACSQCAQTLEKWDGFYNNSKLAQNKFDLYLKSFENDDIESVSKDDFIIPDPIQSLTERHFAFPRQLENKRKSFAAQDHDSILEHGDSRSMISPSLKVRKMETGSGVSHELSEDSVKNSGDEAESLLKQERFNASRTNKTEAEVSFNISEIINFNTESVKKHEMPLKEKIEYQGPLRISQTVQNMSLFRSRRNENKLHKSSKKSSVALPKSPSEHKQFIQVYFCPECNEILVSKDQFLVHIQTHTRKPILELLDHNYYKLPLY